VKKYLHTFLEDASHNPNVWMKDLTILRRKLEIITPKNENKVTLI
jgi:hypothetical protein